MLKDYINFYWKQENRNIVKKKHIASGAKSAPVSEYISILEWNQIQSYMYFSKRFILEKENQKCWPYFL